MATELCFRLSGAARALSPAGALVFDYEPFGDLDGERSRLRGRASSITSPSGISIASARVFDYEPFGDLDRERSRLWGRAPALVRR